MKKKIVFSALTILFCLSAVSGAASGNMSGAIGCFIIAAIFGFLAYRSFNLSRSSNSPASNVCTSPPKNSGTLTPDKSAVSAATPAPKPDFEFMQVKVAGVTFQNADGTGRQTILRQIHFHDSPFDEYIDLELRRYEYDGQPAYGVYANNLQIGNIPADKVQFVSDNWKRLDSLSAINVYGGGRNKEGKPISYGCEIFLKFRAVNPQL